MSLSKPSEYNSTLDQVDGVINSTLLLIIRVPGQKALFKIHVLSPELLFYVSDATRLSYSFTFGNALDLLQEYSHLCAWQEYVKLSIFITFE